MDEIDRRQSLAVADVPAAAEALLLAQNSAGLWERFARQYEQLLTLSRRTRRALVRRWRLSLAGIALALTLGLAGPTAAAPPPSGIVVDGFECTLAEAITAANTDSNYNGCYGSSYNFDTILLQTNVTLGATLPIITTAVTLEGNGYTVDANDTGRVLYVKNPGSLTVNDVTVTGGQVTDVPGAGILARGADLTVTNSTITGNQVLGTSGWYARGGGIYAGNLVPGVGSFPLTLTIANSEISNNQSVRAGGVGIGTAVTASIDQSSVTGNDAVWGGGFYIRNASYMDITNSVISGNTSDSDGAGFRIQGGDQITISNTTIDNNYTASGNGGAIYAEEAILAISASTISNNSGPTSKGGGLFAYYYCEITIENSTISGNSAYFAGGIYAGYASTVTIGSSTLSGNSASRVSGGGGGMLISGGATVYLENSIVSGNNDNVAPEIAVTTGASFVSHGYNVVGTNGAAGTYNASLMSSDVVPSGAIGTVLGPLADNGGPTLTHNLVAGSPAIDLVPGGPATDQRGAPRPISASPRRIPQAGLYDAGSVEYLSTPLAIELATLTANSLPGSGVRVTWETASEIDNAGFNLLRGRSADGADRVAVNGSLIAATGSNGIGATYTFDDTTAGVGTWYYWLEAIDTGGRSTLHGPVSVDVSAPTAVTLRGVGTTASLVVTTFVVFFLLVVTTFVVFFRARRTSPETRKFPGKLTTNYQAPTVETVETQNLASLLGAARALSRRSWDDDGF